MKKPAFWALIIGVLVTVGNVLQLVPLLMDPTELAMVNVAAVTVAILSTLFGVFLIGVYIHSKQTEESVGEQAAVVPNSKEDMARLEKYRNWILAFLFVFIIIGSVEIWILNTYTSLTLMSATLIFDLLANVVFAYFIVQLFRNKNGVLNGVLYVTLFYCIVFALLSGMLGHWSAVIATVLLAVYVAYATVMPMTRTNYRIAQYLLLPLLLLAPMVASVITEKEVSDVSKEYDKAWEQFSVNTDLINGEYSLYLEKEAPDDVLIQDVKDAIEKRAIDTKTIEEHRTKLIELLNAQTPRIAQQKALERLRLNGDLLVAHTAQTGTLMELMQYSESLNFNALSTLQKQKLSDMKSAVDAHSEVISDISFKLNQSNLWN